MSKFSNDKGYQAFCLLQITFVVLPLIAGIDKFFGLLTNWSMYLSPFVLKVVNYHDHAFMIIVGIIEIIAAIGVFFKPKIFSYVVAFWLLAIVFNLVLTCGYYDIALRDAGLFLSALAFGSLSKKYGNV